MRVVCIPAATRKLWKDTTGIEIIDGIGDDEGYSVFQARTDDMIISAGNNIAGPEVEGALLPHRAVARRALENVVAGPPSASYRLLARCRISLIFVPFVSDLAARAWAKQGGRVPRRSK